MPSLPYDSENTEAEKNLSRVGEHCYFCTTVLLWMIFLAVVPIGLPAFVWWPYMGHAGYPTFLLSASGVSFYLCIISSPGTVTLDLMAQSQTLRIVSPKLVTNEALLKKMSNISRLFLITLCLSLHRWSALRQQWPFALFA